MDKPVKLTFGEWCILEYKDDATILSMEEYIHEAKKGFHANDDYIKYLENKNYNRSLEFSKHQGRRLVQINRLREALEQIAGDDEPYDSMAMQKLAKTTLKKCFEEEL